MNSLYLFILCLVAGQSEKRLFITFLNLSQTDGFLFCHFLSHKSILEGSQTKTAFQPLLM